VEAKAEIRDVQKKLIQVGTEVRQLSHDLHPASPKDRGLPDALRVYCDEFSRVLGISVSCDADGAVGELSRGAALALYRIAQEAMGNAVSHGAAQHVDVRLARSNGRVTLTVTDDGKGFDPNRIGGSGGLGLINMRERARQLNGTFELNAQPGRGPPSESRFRFDERSHCPSPPAIAINSRPVQFGRGHSLSGSVTLIQTAAGCR
jgi:signal transduction histidine kinase